ncbi:MAG: CopG family transcriptional regulator [Pseudomonadota bacterium]
MGNQRTIITISEKDKAWLEGFSKARGISMAEAIRRGIAQLKEREEKSTYLTLVEETSGIWKKGDGLAYQEKLRSEWR